MLHKLGTLGINLLFTAYIQTRNNFFLSLSVLSHAFSQTHKIPLTRKRPSVFRAVSWRPLSRRQRILHAAAEPAAPAAGTAAIVVITRVQLSIDARRYVRG